MRLEVDMQPVGPALARQFRGLAHQPLAQSEATMVWVDAGIEQESVNAAIPSDVDEANQRACVIGAKMNQTARQDRLGIARPGLPPRHSP